MSDSPNVLDDQLIFSAPFRSLSHQASWLLPTSAVLNLSPHHRTFSAPLHSRALIKSPFGVGPVQRGVGLMSGVD